MDALHRSQGHAEGRAFFVEQPAACVGLHTGDAHVILLAELVHLNPDRIDPRHGLVVIVSEVVVDIVCGRH